MKDDLFEVFDFDRVLFDTDRFIADLKMYGLNDLSRGPELITAITEAGIDMKSYVFSAARVHLEKHGSRAAIVSAAKSRQRGDNDNVPQHRLDFQVWKIQASGLRDLVTKVTVTEDDKTEAFQELQKKYGRMVVVDDREAHIREAEALGMETFWVKCEQSSGLKGVSQKEGKPGIDQYLTA